MYKVILLGPLESLVTNIVVKIFFSLLKIKLKLNILFQTCIIRNLFWFKPSFLQEHLVIFFLHSLLLYI